VREDLFGRESVRLWMHGCMASMGIKQHPFRARPYTFPHFCGASAHIGLLGGVKNKEIGAQRTRGAALDLGATLAGSPSSKNSGKDENVVNRVAHIG
jgi:hypothetical protein